MREVAAIFVLWLCAGVPAFAQEHTMLPLVGMLRLIPLILPSRAQRFSEMRSRLLGRSMVGISIWRAD